MQLIILSHQKLSHYLMNNPVPVLSQRRGKLLLGVGLVPAVAVSLARFGGGAAVRLQIVAAAADHESRGVVEDSVLAAHLVPRVLHLALHVIVERFEP